MTVLGGRRARIQFFVATLAANRVVQRQVAFALIFCAALAAVPVVDPGVNSTGFLVLGVALEIAVVVAAAVLPWGRWPPAAQDALPLASVAALLAFERGVSSQSDYFSLLVLLPVCTLAWTSGRRGVILGTASAVAVVLLPELWLDSSLGDDAAVFRSLTLPLVALSLAVFVADAASGLRARAAAQEALADQLRTSRDLVVGLVEAATEQAIVATDPQGVIEVFNQGAENLSGRTAESMTGRSIMELGVSEELDEALEQDGPPAGAEHLAGDALRWAVLVGPTATTGGAHVRDWTLVRGDEPLTVRLTVTRRMPLPGDEDRGYLLVATDVTAQRASEDAKDEFLGYVSHELRTPISSVLGYLELLGLDDDNLTDDQRSHLEVIARNAQRLLHLVEDLLLRAQVDAGHFTVRPVPVDLAEILAASVESAAPFASSHGLVLANATVGAVPLTADPVRLGQMIDNLVSNALKFTPAGGRIEVRAARERSDDGAPQAVLTVQDDGVGIAPDELRHLTERFYRASSATQRRVPGVGLGLSITQAIIDAHGGTLTITSEEGRGTTFTVVLPAGTAATTGPV